MFLIIFKTMQINLIYLRFNLKKIKILSLPGDITMRFSDEGASMITVDSGMITYDYILPAQSK